MGDFISRRRPDFDDLHVERQRHPRQGMVRINGNRVVADFDDGHHARTFRRIRLELVPDFDFGSIRKAVQFDFGDERIIVLAVTVFRGHTHLQRGPFRQTFECRFQPRNDLPGSVQIGQRLTPFGRIEDFPVFIREGVFDTHDGVGGGVHGRFLES